MSEIFKIMVFPGFLFLVLTSFLVEYLDRKLHARFQNRVGPPCYQPVADFIKLLGKEIIFTKTADKIVVSTMPVFALAATVTAYLYIPLWRHEAIFSFDGDMIVVLYLLTLPTFAFFLGAWYSQSIYAMFGAVRSLTQLFAYEVPLLLSVLASALLANTWSMDDLTRFYSEHPGYWLFNLVGFVTAVIALIGKLEKVPFDIPEAETEIVAGWFTEYGGVFFAFIRLTLNVEMIVGASLLAAVFLPFGLGFGPALGFLIYAGKVLFIILIITLTRTVLARLRIDQMMEFCWKYVSSAAFLQILATLTIKGVLNP